MIFVVISQEDRLVTVEKLFQTLENAKNHVDSLQFNRETELEWEKINNLWHKSYKTSGSRVVFTIYERELQKPELYELY